MAGTSDEVTQSEDIINELTYQGFYNYISTKMYFLFSFQTAYVSHTTSSISGKSWVKIGPQVNWNIGIFQKKNCTPPPVEDINFFEVNPLGFPVKSTVTPLKFPIDILHRGVTIIFWKSPLAAHSWIGIQ